MIKDEKMNKKNADLSEKNRATMIMKKNIYYIDNK